MSEFQTKIGGGLNKLQGSLQQGKQKLQTAQETSQYRKVVSDEAQKRVQLIIDLGELAYLKVRSNQLDDDEMRKSVEAIVSHDKEVFKAKKMISLLTARSANSETCSCGSPITSDMKYCGSCGQKVEIMPESSEAERECGYCEQMIPVSAQFCTCCGRKQAD
ncbi:double zinc ribbon domain-containing protein [[Bacillus] enclensis]|uniref:double zinc ribbon domain-containing protein n=1 Tax=[Bacillus] enclensis TaxID=1402860 RepID=UPI0018DD3C85|nr:zinc ribbon domain-containing protein [[Bacillus] enclensis]MBH9968185.1 zinc ribbon domain-containing protein [[Bacillus] enclensis]